jgi:hypothetical protein
MATASPKPVTNPSPRLRRAFLLAFLAAFVLSLGAPGLLAEDYHDNVVVVLDASGSMKDPMPGGSTSKMAAAKSALKTVLRQVPDSTSIGLLVFSARNIQDPWVFPLGPRDNDRLTAAIDRLEPYGNTPLGHYIKVGADRLLQERTRQFGYGSYRLLIVTDGEAQDQDLVNRYTPDILARGITMDVIGVAMAQAHTLARKAHSYRRADDDASLQRAVAEVLAEVARPRTDVAQSDAFELLAPLPAEVAAAALQALSTSGNHPIGEPARTSDPLSRPLKPSASQPQAVGPQPAAPNAAQPAQPVQPAQPPPPSQPVPGPRRRSGSPSIIVIIVIVIIASAAFRRMARRGPR